VNGNITVKEKINYLSKIKQNAIDAATEVKKLTTKQLQYQQEQIIKANDLFDKILSEHKGGI